MDNLISGNAWQTWFTDKLILPVLPDSQAWAFVAWYQSASAIKHLYFHVLVSLNIMFLSWPAIFIFGSVYIKLRNFLVLKALEQKRHSVR